MHHAFVRVTAQAWVLLKLWICPEDMVRNENIVVSDLFNGLHEGMNRPKISADFGLRKDSADVHNDGSLVRSFPLTIWRPDVGRSTACPLRSLSTPVLDGATLALDPQRRKRNFSS